MRIDTALRFVLILCACCVMGMFIIRVLNVSLWRTREEDTRIDLNCLTAAIELLMRDCGDSFYQLTSEKPNGATTKRMLEVMLTRQLMEDIWNRISDGDGWGRAYNIAWRTSFNNTNSVMLEANTNSLLIWSSGQNGINEFGNGDDIYDARDWIVLPAIQ